MPATNIPVRTLSDTPATHRDDHNEGFGAVNSATESSEFLGSPDASNSAAADTAAWQAALTLGQSTHGVRVVPSPGVYRMNATLKYYGQTRIDAVGWSDNQDFGSGSHEGTTLAWYGSALAKNRALLEGANYSGSNAEAHRGCRFEGFMINGRSATTGNGMIAWDARMHMHHVFILGWAGTSIGHGMALKLASDNLTRVQTSDTYGSRTGGTVLGGGENNFIKDCRFRSNRERIYIDSGGDQYTDGVLEDIEFLKDTGGSGSPAGGLPLADVICLQGGGWEFKGLHFNAPIGDAIYMRSSAFTTIADCFIDGAGCNPGSQTDSYGIHIDGFSGFRGGNGGLIIRDNKYKAHGEQNTTAFSGHRWAFLCVEPGSLGFDGTASIHNNLGWRRAEDNGDTATDGTGTTHSGQAGNFFMCLAAPTNSAKMRYTLTGNVPEFYEDGSVGGANALPFRDRSLFQIPTDVTAATDYIQAGNVWQMGDASPANGWWPRGTLRYRRNAATGSPLGWVNTAAHGQPGTWTALPNL